MALSSAAGSTNVAQESCCRWLLEALAAATRVLRRKGGKFAEPAVSHVEDTIPLEDVIGWDSECEFAGRNVEKQRLIYASQHSFCLLTPRPVLPGHAVVCPRRQVKALFDLTKEEVTDLFLTTQVVSWLLNRYWGCTASTIRLQQGEGARQTLPHLFVHVVPRKANDLPCNDDIYKLLDEAIPLLATEGIDADGARKSTLHEGHGGDRRSSLVENSSSVPQRKSPANVDQGPCSCESTALCRANLDRQSQQIRSWLLELALDKRLGSDAGEGEK